MKLLLIGWESIGWPAVLPPLGSGKLPHLRRLLSNAFAAEWPLPRLRDSAALWTTLLTGRPPARHGVVTSIEAAPLRAGLQPVGREVCRFPSIFSMARDAGYRIHAINWPASHPSQSLGGICVSDRFFSSAVVPADSVSPVEVYEELATLRLAPHELSGEPCSNDQKRFLAGAATVQAIALRATEWIDADVLAVRYGAPPPQETAAALDFLDEALGRLLERAAGARVVLAGMPGLFISSAPPEAMPSIQSVRLIDIAPSLLALLGLGMTALPGRRDERICVCVPDRQCDSSTIDIVRDDEKPDPSVDLLLSLGYREAPDLYALHAISIAEHQQAKGMALAHLDVGEPLMAIGRLEALPIDLGTGTIRIEACIRAGRLSDAREIINKLIAMGHRTALAESALAMLDALENRPGAEQRLAEAEKGHDAPALVLSLIGRGYLHLRKWEQARRLFAGADDQEGLAQLYIRQRRWEEAAEHAAVAVSRQPESIDAWYCLGVARDRTGQIAEAITALLRAAALDWRRSPAIDRRLADLYEKTGDLQAAMEHRLRTAQAMAFRRQRQQLESLGRDPPADG